MAIQKNIKINVDTDEAVRDLNKLEGSLKEVNQEAGKTTTGIKDVGENGGAIAVLDSLTGGLATRFRDAYEASKLFNFSLKGTRAALIATGIGLFVVALGTIVAYWSEISEAITGSNKLLQKRIDLLNESTRIRNHELTMLDLEEKILIANGESTDGILETRKLLLIAQQATNNQLIDELTTKLEIEKVDNRKLTFLERAANASGGLLDVFGIDVTGGKKQGAEVTDEEKQAEKDLDDLINKTKEANKELELTLILLNKTSGGGGGKDKGLTDEEKEMREIDRALSIARALKKIREDEEAEEEARAEREIDRELAVSRALKKIREDEAATELKLNELKAQARQKQLVGIGNALSQTSALLGEATAEGKALAIASAGISTFLTAQQAYQAAFQPVPTVASPVLGAIFAGIAVAGGLANIAKIAAVKVPGGKGGGRGGVSGGASAPAAPSFNLIQGTGTNQISQSINNQNQNPTKAFVVSKDVTSSQELDRNIESNSAL